MAAIGCQECFYFSPAGVRIDGRCHCALAVTAAIWRRDYPALFPPRFRFPPTPAEVSKSAVSVWAGYIDGCDLAKHKCPPVAL